MDKKLIESYLKDVFENKNERKICKDDSLYVVQNDQYHYYKIGGNMTTGFQGFKEFMEIMPMRSLIYPIYFNGQELSENQTEQFWKQFDKFCKIK